MAKTLKVNPRKLRLGLYDSDTGKSCKAEKFVDITSYCPKASLKDRAVLVFTRAKRGRIVMICRPYVRNALGKHSHYFVDEFESEMRTAPRDDTFGSWADELGLTKPMLRKMVENLAPP